MTDVRSAWNDAGERLSGLGHKLKTHYDQQRGTDGEHARAQVEDAAKRLGEAVKDAFDAIGTAAKDSAVKDDVKQVGQSLAKALTVTFTEVSGEVRKTFTRPTGGVDPGAPEPSGAATTKSPAPETAAPEPAEPRAVEPPAAAAPPADAPPTADAQ